MLFTEFSNVTAITLTSNVVTAITMATGSQFRRYVLDNEMMSTSSNYAFDPKNGTYHYIHKVDFTTKGWTTTVKAEIHLLSINKLIAIVKENSGVYRIYGGYKGLDVLTATDENGAELNSFHGQKMALEGKETAYAYEVNSGIIAALLSPAS